MNLYLNKANLIFLCKFQEHWLAPKQKRRTYEVYCSCIFHLNVFNCMLEISKKDLEIPFHIHIYTHTLTHIHT